MIYKDEHTPVDQPGALLQCFDVTVFEIILKKKNICFNFDTIDRYVWRNTLKLLIIFYLKLLLSM